MTSPRELHARALDLLGRGDTAGGISDLKEYLELEPDDAAAHLELGTAYLAVDHLPDAYASLKTAVLLDGENVDARLGYARALVRMKKLDDAAFQLIQATKLDPSDARVLKELGIVFYDKRLFEKAALYLGKACAAAPSDARAHYALGLAHEGRRDMGGAVAAYREAIRKDSKLVDAYQTLADTLASMGEHEGAVNALDGLLGIDRKNEQAARNREVLARALDEMRGRRLLGKSQKELEASALISEGGFKNKGAVDRESGTLFKYTAKLTVVLAEVDSQGAIDALTLVLTDPDRAARSEDDLYRVTVVSDDGRTGPVNFATAVTLTFLREALGCPMTKATELYARLLSGKGEVSLGGASLAFTTIPNEEKPAQTQHGIRVFINRV